MIITKNSDPAALYGVSVVASLSDVNHNFDNFDGMGLLFSTCGTTLSNDEIGYIFIMTQLAVGSTLRNPTMYLTEDGATALKKVLAAMETPPFSVTVDNSVNVGNKLAEDFIYTFNLDGSGGCSDDDIMTLLGMVLSVFSKARHKDIALPLLEALTEKKTTATNLEVSLALPSVVDAKSLYSAFNTALVDMDSEGIDTSIFFENGKLDDDPEN